MIGSHDPEQVRSAAEEILSRKQFQEPAGNRILDAIEWVLDHLFPDSLRSSVGTGPGLLGDLVLLSLAVFVCYLIYRLIRGWRPRAKSDVPEAQLTIDIEERRSAAEWEKLALRLIAQGRFGEALRARYGELVARLVDDGSVASIAGRTSGEFRSDVALTRPAGARAFSDASELFERVWYGGEEASADDAERVRVLGADVLRSPKARLELGSEDAVEPDLAAAPS